MAKKRKAAKRKKVVPTWSTRDVNLLKRLFPTNPTSKIAKMVHRKLDAVKKKASRLGLQKSKKYLKTLGKA
jgi:hypothetical protein